MLTGRDVGAREAERIGLVSRQVPAEDLLPTCYEIAERIAAFSRPGTELTNGRCGPTGRQYPGGHMQAEGLGNSMAPAHRQLRRGGRCAGGEAPPVFPDEK